MKSPFCPFCNQPMDSTKELTEFKGLGLTARLLWVLMKLYYASPNKVPFRILQRGCRIETLRVTVAELRGALRDTGEDKKWRILTERDSGYRLIRIPNELKRVRDGERERRDSPAECTKANNTRS